MRNIKKTLILVVAVLASCSVCNAEVVSRNYEISSGYVLKRNWSWGYTEEYYYLSGQLRFTYDVPLYAEFNWVDVELDEEITYFEPMAQTTTSLDELFHMTELQLTDANETEINFVYEKNIPTFPLADVNVTVTFAGDNLLLTGRFSDALYDGWQYDLYAIATRMCYSGGTGEPNNPYRIATPNDLNDIGNHIEDYNKHFIMVSDINLAAFTGTQFNIIGNDINPFTGVFDGNGHTISNFTWNSTGMNHIGIFGCVSGADAEIKNLCLANPNVDAGTGDYVGSLVGRMNDSMIAGCKINGGNISGHDAIGGLIGKNDYGTISNCCATCDVSGIGEWIGGLVGQNQLGGVIANSYATGNIFGGDTIGGLVGLLEDDDSTITHCYATGSVDGGFTVGGLVGMVEEDAVIMYCRATGTVHGDGDYVGGLVGDIQDMFAALISNCYAAGDVSGDDNIGGLVGRFGDEAEILNCYATGAVEGDVDVGGLVGDNSGSIIASFWDIQTGGPDNGIGTPLPTEQMQTERTFTDAGWDMVNIWDIGENQTYPFLRTHLPSDINKDGETNFYDFAILAEHWLSQ